MIQKEDFYHGAAIIQLLEVSGEVTIRKEGQGYVLNDASYLLLKYTTKPKGPWRFTTSSDDINRIREQSLEFERFGLALVCAGDGICTIDYPEFAQIHSMEPGWIAVRRNHGKQYSVAGPLGELERKIARNRWNQLLDIEESLLASGEKEI